MSDPPDVWRAGRDGVSVRFYLLLFIAWWASFAGATTLPSDAVVFVSQVTDDTTNRFFAPTCGKPGDFSAFG